MNNFKYSNNHIALISFLIIFQVSPFLYGALNDRETDIYSKKYRECVENEYESMTKKNGNILKNEDSLKKMMDAELVCRAKLEHIRYGYRAEKKTRVLYAVFPAVIFSIIATNNFSRFKEKKQLESKIFLLAMGALCIFIGLSISLFLGMS